MRDRVNGYVGHPSPKHVFVGTDSLPKPGLLLAWRRGRHGWEGYVIEATGGGPTEPLVMMHWVPASELREA